MASQFDNPSYGPWPQPAPNLYEAAAPAVLNVPDAVHDDWKKHVERRYFGQILTLTPKMWWRWRRKPGLVPVSDERFCEILCDGIFSKFLTPESNFDAPDRARFADYLSEPLGSGESYYKSDFSPMRLVASDDDSATVPSVVLFKRDAQGKYRLVAIALEDDVFDPVNVAPAAWKLAKYFALQGAGVLTTLLMHPKLHFPSNSVDAISRTRLADGPLRRLLLPHFRLALGVNRAVLYGKQTVLRPGRLYAPYPGSLAQHGRVVAALWSGYPHDDGTPNSAYPPYRLSLDPPDVHSPYGDFLGHYFELLLGFVSEAVTPVLSARPKDVSAWADHCATWLPGFPNATAIYQSDNLARAITSIILDVAVGHSADHYQYDRVNLQEVPFRLHTEVPRLDTTTMPPLSSLTTWRDNFNYAMCQAMFFAPHVVEPLSRVDYGFDDPVQQDAARTFFADLQALQATLKAEELSRYLPLGQLASSVQF